MKKTDRQSLAKEKNRGLCGLAVSYVPGRALMPARHYLCR